MARLIPSFRRQDRDFNDVSKDEANSSGHESHVSSRPSSAGQRQTPRRISTLLSAGIQKLLKTQGHSRGTSLISVVSDRPADDHTSNPNSPRDYSMNRSTSDSIDFQTFADCVMKLSETWQNPVIAPFRAVLLADAWKAINRLMLRGVDADPTFDTSLDAQLIKDKENDRPTGDRIVEQKGQKQTQADLETDQRGSEKHKARTDRPVTSTEALCRKCQEVLKPHGAEEPVTSPGVNTSVRPAPDVEPGASSDDCAANLLNLQAVLKVLQQICEGIDNDVWRDLGDTPPNTLNLLKEWIRGVRKDRKGFINLISSTFEFISQCYNVAQSSDTDDVKVKLISEELQLCSRTCDAWADHRTKCVERQLSALKEARRQIEERTCKHVDGNRSAQDDRPSSDDRTTCSASAMDSFSHRFRQKLTQEAKLKNPDGSRSSHDDDEGQSSAAMAIDPLGRLASPPPTLQDCAESSAPRLRGRDFGADTWSAICLNAIHNASTGEGDGRNFASKRRLEPSSFTSNGSNNSSARPNLEPKSFGDPERILTFESIGSGGSVNSKGNQPSLRFGRYAGAYAALDDPERVPTIESLGSAGSINSKISHLSQRSGRRVSRGNNRAESKA